MAGHSKWANIRFRKQAQDAKRGKIFTKLIREITQAAREGGGDVDSNPKLRLAIDKALRANMTRDTVTRAVAKGSGVNDGENFVAMLYEGYAPGGVALMVSCLTDNKNRTVAEVRHAFSKYGGELGVEGSVSYLFRKVGLILVKTTDDEDDVFEYCIENGASEIEPVEFGYQIEIEPGNFGSFNQTLSSKSDWQIEGAELTYIAQDLIQITDEERAQKILKIVDVLEDLDDVQAVHGNYEIEQSLLEKLG